MAPRAINLNELAAILYFAYGQTRKNQGTQFPRPFRTVPSGGALYPLEIYCHTVHATGLIAGLYHYNPSRHDLRLLQPGDRTNEFAAAMVQGDIAQNCSALFFITAIFERTVFKYGNKGYRFVLLEAGHVAQNIALAAAGLGFGSISIGGFFDREIDALLAIDGVSHSSLYLAAVGGSGVAATEHSRPGQ
jgi:SagB-type dehydrogenase family enzyme